MISLMYLSLNPNLTQAQFEAAAKQYLDGKERLVKQMVEGAKGLPPEQAIEYLSYCLQVYCAF